MSVNRVGQFHATSWAAPFLWLLSFFFIVAHDPVIGAPAAAAAPVKMLTPAQLQEDLSRLEFTLQRAHGDPYRYIAKSNLDAMFAGARTQLTSSMTDLEFYRVVAPIVAAVRDSHTSIRPPAALRAYLSSNRRRVFPLAVRYVDGEPFVDADLGDTPANFRGFRLLSIDSRPMEEITKTVSAALVRDGFVRRDAQLSRSFWYYYLSFYGEKPSYHVVLQDPVSGTSISRSLAGIPPKRLADHASPKETLPTQRIELPGDGLAIMTIDELSNPATGAFLERAFRQAHEGKISDLIIDLRKCPGGQDKYNNQLLSYLMKEPFRFYRGREFRVKSYDDIRFLQYGVDDFLFPDQVQQLPSSQRAAPLKSLTLPELLRFMLSVDGAEGVFQPSSKYRFEGDVYLLVGSDSSSSAAEIAALMHHLDLATLIGEEPNGAYGGLVAGAIPQLVLPHSAIEVTVPLVRYYNNVTPGYLRGRGAPPTFPVSTKLSDDDRKLDIVMKFARDLIMARRRPTGHAESKN